MQGASGSAVAAVAEVEVIGGHRVPANGVVQAAILHVRLVDEVVNGQPARRLAAHTKRITDGTSGDVLRDNLVVALQALQEPCKDVAITAA